MDGHPIPQDVTGFQFKLIGDMTIKQFAYVIVGVIFAWIFFSLPVAILLKLPFALFFLCFGLSLAFLPVEGRPLDLMVTYFFKALFSPNQFLFIKIGVKIIPPLPHRNYQPTTQEQSKTISAENLQALLASTSTNAPKNDLDQKEMAFLNLVSSAFQGGALPPPQQQPVVEKPEDAAEVEQELEEQTRVLKEELAKEKEEVQKEEAGEGNDKTVQEENERIAKLEQLLNETISQKNALEQQLLSLQKQLEVPRTATTPKPPKDTIKSTKLPIIEQNPNLISGIIKDSRGNVLPNILVEIRDQEQNPVRAFKTNQLGQFASATPLLNGTYTLIFEDPSEKHKFESLEIIANGEFIPPLAIASIDAREELRKSLFNN